MPAVSYISGPHHWFLDKIHFLPIMGYNLRSQEIKAPTATSLGPSSLRPLRTLVGGASGLITGPPK